MVGEAPQRLPRMVNEMTEPTRILDATAGKRMMWFDKQNENVVYLDLKREVKPDIVADFRALPLRDSTFDLVVFDPPHTSAGEHGIFIQTFGALRAHRFVPDLYKASRELKRVLRNGGILIFKWNTHDYSLERAISLFPLKALFGQKTAYKTQSGSSTYWTTFLKQILGDSEASSS